MLYLAVFFSGIWFAICVVPPPHMQLTCPFLAEVGYSSTGLIVAIERPDERVPKFKIHVSNIGKQAAMRCRRMAYSSLVSSYYAMLFIES